MAIRLRRCRPAPHQSTWQNRIRKVLRCRRFGGHQTMTMQGNEEKSANVQWQIDQHWQHAGVGRKVDRRDHHEWKYAFNPLRLDDRILREHT